MTPYMDDGDVRLYLGDAVDVLRELPAESVHMAVTSPPFFGLRDYGMKDQIGLEASPDEWCDRLVNVFREVRRVLRRDGTLWVECGDSYAGNGSGSPGPSGLEGRSQDATRTHGRKRGAKPKDLILAPHLLAAALRDDGWYLRSTIIWHKPNPMPESVQDRPTTSHSYLFLLSKAARYYWDSEAIKEEAEYGRRDWNGGVNFKGGDIAVGHGRTSVTGADPSAGRNSRSVWTIPTEPNGLAVCANPNCQGYWQRDAPRQHCGLPVVQHYAAFPRELVRRAILAGTSERGCCPECGAPWEREVERERTMNGKPIERGGWAQDEAGRLGPQGVGHWRFATETATTGWKPCCDCGERSDVSSTNESMGDPQSKNRDNESFPEYMVEGLVSAPDSQQTDTRERRQLPVVDNPRVMVEVPLASAGERADSDSGIRGASLALEPERGPAEEGPGMGARAPGRPTPCTVLDPFSGSGTTLLVARQLGRHAIGIDLSEPYARMTRHRLSQQSLFASTEGAA